MKILIVAAMQKELDLLLKQLSDCDKRAFENIDIYVGNIHGHEVIASKCGIGKVNSALRTDALIREFDPDLVINSGVAGGVDESMGIGDLLIPDSVSYHDVWCGPGTEYGAADGYPVYFTPDIQIRTMLCDACKQQGVKVKSGLICSGDKFISTPEEVSVIKSKFAEARGCDMESASISQVCMMHGVKCLIVRVLSDRPGGGENLSEYKNFWNDAPARTFEAVSLLLKTLLISK
ncbi:MAG: 5'-methylthioadenosine/adenosylhomocysteine nucleosidase [Muribaculaceae bacterium]|nr:5'-methylthioadenosine/adenosylhomocysteine nucleosidase [Muribaculaceae bacterium]